MAVVEYKLVYSFMKVTQTRLKKRRSPWCTFIRL